MFTPEERIVIDEARARLEIAFDNAMMNFADDIINLVSLEEINEFAKASLERVLREESEPDEPWDGFRSDAEADADVLRSAGWGTDEDYGPMPIDDDRFETADFYTGGDE